VFYCLLFCCYFLFCFVLFLFFPFPSLEKNEVKPWNDGLFPWSNSLKKQFTKPLFPSLGVNRMWTKRNDHAPKSSCVDLFIICPKMRFRKKIKFNHSLAFSCLQFSKLIFFIIPIFFCHGPLNFFIGAPLFLSHRKTRWIMLTDNVNLIIMSFEDFKLHDHFDKFSLV
jgi:hypothetical protein